MHVKVDVPEDMLTQITALTGNENPAAVIRQWLDDWLLDAADHLDSIEASLTCLARDAVARQHILTERYPASDLVSLQALIEAGEVQMADAWLTEQTETMDHCEQANPERGNPERTNPERTNPE